MAFSRRRPLTWARLLRRRETIAHLSRGPSDYLIGLVRHAGQKTAPRCFGRLRCCDLGVDLRVYSFAHAPNLASFGRERAGQVPHAFPGRKHVVFSALGTVGGSSLIVLSMARIETYQIAELEAGIAVP